MYIKFVFFSVRFLSTSYYSLLIVPPFKIYIYTLDLDLTSNK